MDVPTCVVVCKGQYFRPLSCFCRLEILLAPRMHSKTLRAGDRVKMRIRVIKHPTKPHIDGIQLTQFQPGSVYELGYSLGPLFLAEGWGEPADAPSSHMTFTDMSALARQPHRHPDDPMNLVRERYPPYLEDRRAVAADFRRRRRSRR